MKTLLSLLLLCISAFGSTKTTIADTLASADGTLLNGSIQIDQPSLTLVDGSTVQKSVSKVQITNGALSTQLYPNDTSYPSGTYYRVSYSLITNAGTTNYTEYWVVPTSSSSVTVAAIRTTSIPIPNLLYSCTQLPSGCPSLVNFSRSYTNVTSVTIPSSLHALGPNLLYRAVNTSGSRVYGDPTLDTFGNFTLSFSQPFTGTVKLLPGLNTANYSQSFSSVTSVVLTSGDYGLDTLYTEVQCYNSSFVSFLGNLAVDTNSFNITLTTSSAVTGRCVVGAL